MTRESHRSRGLVGTAPRTRHLETNRVYLGLRETETRLTTVEYDPFRIDIPLPFNILAVQSVHLDHMLECFISQEFDGGKVGATHSSHFLEIFNHLLARRLWAHK